MNKSNELLKLTLQIAVATEIELTLEGMNI